jgi:hypothetical protein
MSSTSFKIFRCDRCGEEDRVESGAVPTDWGRIAAEKAGGGARIGHAEAGADDLCAGCLQDLFAWFGEPRNLRASPAPPPAPPAPPPAASFDEAARGVAETRAIAVLDEQLGVALRAIQEQPTSVLTGEWPEGARAGLEARAKALVDSILDQLKIGRPKRRKALAAA